MVSLLDAQAAEQSGGVAFGVPALQLRKFLLQLGGAYAVGVAEVLFGVYGVFLLHYVPEHRVSAQHRFHHRAVVELKVVLTEHAQTLARAKRYCAVGGLQLAAEYAHQRRLARAVGTDDAVAVARRKCEVNVLKKSAFAKLLAKIVYLYHYKCEAVSRGTLTLYLLKMLSAEVLNVFHQPLCAAGIISLRHDGIT